MQIPVCYITQYGNIIGTIDYLDNHIFRDNRDNYSIERELPLQDLISCEVINNNICTVVGRDKKYYIVCFGDNYLYRINRDTLIKYNISNAKQTRDNRIIITDKIHDLGCLFPDKDIIFDKNYIGEYQTSLGIARKFFAKYKGHYCIVKFSKRSDNKDLENEIKYYKIARILGVDCCRVIYSKYDGRDCCISIFEYNREKDVFSSFRKLNKPLGKIYEQLSDKDKIKYNNMMILDFVLSQQDRHYSNIALCNNRLYPLFDNGECLGIGSIGHFSANNRQFVKKLPVNYIRKFISRQQLAEILKILNEDEQHLLRNNLKELSII